MFKHKFVKVYRPTKSALKNEIFEIPHEKRAIN